MSSNDGNPSKLSGQLHSVKGQLKEGLGNAFKSSNLAQSGAAERDAGRSDVAAARGDRVGPGGSATGANAFAGGPDYGNLEGPTYNSGEPRGTMSMGTGGSIGSGPGVTGGPGNAHLGNDNFTSGTRTGNPTAAAYNEFEPTGTDTLSGTNTPTGLARGEAALHNRNAQQDVKEWSRNAF